MISINTITETGSRRRRRVPSLARLCLRVLARYPGHVPIDVRLTYDALDDVLDDELTPPLWAALVQVYDRLPPHLRSLTICLADPHLIFLQQIPQTSLFSLITVLDLPACPHLTDSSIVHLGTLHSVVAFDASATSLTSYAIKVLAGTLLWIDDGPQRRGPWSLRILRLRFCDKIDNTIYPHLAKFPLLTVIDLRGTNCDAPSKDQLNTFEPSSRSELFHPAPLAAAVDALEGTDSYTSKDVFRLLIDSINPSKVTHNLSQYTDESVGPDKTMESTAMSRCSTRHLEPNSDIITLESTPGMFYSQPSRSSRPIKYDLVNDYRATSYYTWAHLEVVARPAGPHDSELALFRTPPPWIILEEHSTFLLNQMEARRSTKNEPVTRVASINRTERIFQVNQARIEALRESASARRKSSVCASTTTPQPRLGRNPFRRYSVPAVGDLDRGMKDLKPISAVEVPELPSDVKKTTCYNTITNAPRVFQKSIGQSVNSKKPIAFHHSRSDSQTTSMKRTSSIDNLRPSAKKFCVDGGSGDKGQKKPAVQVNHKSFDWRAWAAK